MPSTRLPVITPPRTPWKDTAVTASEQRNTLATTVTVFGGTTSRPPAVAPLPPARALTSAIDRVFIRASWALARAVTREEPEMIWMCANSRSPHAHPPERARGAVELEVGVGVAGEGAAAHRDPDGDRGGFVGLVEPVGQPVEQAVAQHEVRRDPAVDAELDPVAEGVGDVGAPGEHEPRQGQPVGPSDPQQHRLGVVGAHDLQ